jgi:two-component system nitrogen regulation response regulator GlnG
MPRLLIVDDESAICYSIRRMFADTNIEIETASTAATGLKRAQAGGFDAIVLDLQLPDRSGLELFRDLQALDPKRPVVFITAHGTTDTAIEAMKQGAFEYLVKPIDAARLTQVIERAFAAAQLMGVPALLPTDARPDRIIGRSSIMQEMSKAIGRIAPQDVNVLIVGETGAGKELVARAIYHHSRRANKPFLAINCAAIPENLLESELFGHEEGAFTGATRRRVGKFEQCNGGTLFLDEIGDMALPLQAKLLRVLQEHEFEPVGGNRSIKSQVRVLAATNQDLEKAMAEGRFRKDLFFRLRDVAINVPSLRERREDISEIAHHFLFTFGRDMGREVRGYAADALELLVDYEWPGNVRELQGAVKQAVLASAGPLIETIDLPEAIRKTPLAVEAIPAIHAESLDVVAFIKQQLQKGEKDLYIRVLRRVELALFEIVLQSTKLNQVQASEILGINRATLRKKLREFGVSMDITLLQDSEPPQAD